MTEEVKADATVAPSDKGPIEAILSPVGTGSMANPAAAALVAGMADAAPAAPAGDPSITERARALVESYSHALTTNSPRTVAELDELQALLFHSDGV